MNKTINKAVNNVFFNIFFMKNILKETNKQTNLQNLPAQAFPHIVGSFQIKKNTLLKKRMSNNICYEAHTKQLQKHHKSTMWTFVELSKRCNILFIYCFIFFKFYCRDCCSGTRLIRSCSQTFDKYLCLLGWVAVILHGLTLMRTIWDIFIDFYIIRYSVPMHTHILSYWFLRAVPVWRATQFRPAYYMK